MSAFPSLPPLNFNSGPALSSNGPQAQGDLIGGSVGGGALDWLNTLTRRSPLMSVVLIGGAVVALSIALKGGSRAGRSRKGKRRRKSRSG